MPGPNSVQLFRRPWMPTELTAMTKAMPRPENGVERFISAIENMNSLYSPIPLEMDAILEQLIGPIYWFDLRETLNPCLTDDYDPTTVKGKALFKDCLTALFRELRKKYPKTGDWTQMAVRQGFDEMASDYMKRLTQAVMTHSGIENTEQINILVSLHFMNGVREEVRAYVIKHCVPWRYCEPSKLLAYAERFEYDCIKKREKKKEKLQEEVLSFYHKQLGGQRQRRGGQRSGCYACGKPGHFVKDCWTK